MDDLISRQAAIEALLKLVEARRTWINTEDARKEISGIDASMCAIHGLHPQNARRKTGRWIREVLGSTSGYGTTVMYQCTECESMSISKYSYCPNCGADMRGE